MTTYGVTPQGFNRKPLAVILAEIENRNVTEYGPDLIQTPQSPMGTLNGLAADLVAELWEIAEDVYQSYDPDQAEGARLEMLAQIRKILRNGRDDPEYRQAITNQNQARVDIQDVEAALLSLAGVTYAKLFTDREEFTTGVAVAVIGGEDSAIAATLRRYIVPGVNTYGNARVEVEVEGRCRSHSIIRPIDTPVTLELQIKLRSGDGSCPPPASGVLVDALTTGWEVVRSNGEPVSPFAIRSVLERLFPQVEVAHMIGERDSINYGLDQPVPIGFIEIASIAAEDITVVLL